MRHPHRRQAEHVREDVVRQRAADIGQDRRAAGWWSWRARSRPSAPRDARDRAAWRGTPRRAPGAICTIGKPCRSRWRRSAGRNVVRIDADHEAQLPARPGARRHGVHRAFRIAGAHRQDLERAPGEDLLGRASGPARPSSDRWPDRPGPLDLAVGERAPHRSGMPSGTHSGTRIWPVGPAMVASACASWIAGIGQEPAPVAGMVAALARVDPEVDRKGAAACRERSSAGRRRGADRPSRSARRRRTARGSPRRARASRGEPVSSPISISHLALKPSLPRVREHGAERGDVDRVLALVVGDAAALVAPLASVSCQGERPALPRASSPRMTSPWP